MVDDARAPAGFTVAGQEALVSESTLRLEPVLQYQYAVMLSDRLVQVGRAVFPERLPGTSASYAAVEDSLTALRGRSTRREGPVRVLRDRGRRMQPLVDGQVPTFPGATLTFSIGYLIEQLASVDIATSEVARNDGRPGPVAMLAWDIVTTELWRPRQGRPDLYGALDPVQDEPLFREYEQERTELEVIGRDGVMTPHLFEVARACGLKIGTSLLKRGYGDEVRLTSEAAGTPPPQDRPMW